jgi:hypothetical protein
VFFLTPSLKVLVILIYSFGKINSQKRNLKFTILRANLAICSNNFIKIVNQVQYVDNQFSYNFQPISLHIVKSFMNWCP